MQKWHWFQWISTGVLFLFLAIISYVTFIAYTRPSGLTGLDMVKMQKIRHDHRKNL